MSTSSCFCFPVSICFDLLLNPVSFVLLFQFTDIQCLPIAPDALQIIEESVVTVKDVYDDVAVIHKDPVGRLITFHLTAGAAHFAKFLFHVVYHGLNLVGIGTACYNKVIRHNGNVADIDDADIFALFVG